MPDGLKQPTRGPDALLDEERPPTRGQNETIAQLAARLLDFPLASRYDATVAIVRLKATVRDEEGRITVPEPEMF